MIKPPGIDVHAHFFPETFIRVVEEAGASFGAGVDRSSLKGPALVVGASPTSPLEARYCNLDLRIRSMNRRMQPLGQVWRAAGTIGAVVVGSSRIMDRRPGDE